MPASPPETGSPPPGNTPFTSAVLLAAGASRRMRSLKALLDWQGRPLIIHQIAALRAGGADEVVVVLGHRADELQARIGANSDVYAAGNVRCVINRDYLRGKTTSIIAGLRAIAPLSPSAGDSDGSILLLNVDQPRSPAIIRQVLDAHHANPGALITIPTCGGKRRPPHRNQPPPLLRNDSHHRGNARNARPNGTPPPAHPPPGTGPPGTAMGSKHPGAVRSSPERRHCNIASRRRIGIRAKSALPGTAADAKKKGAGIRLDRSVCRPLMFPVSSVPCRLSGGIVIPSRRCRQGAYRGSASYGSALPAKPLQPPAMTMARLPSGFSG